MSILTEYINRKMDVKEIEAELRSLLKMYNEKTNAYIFVYASAMAKPVPDIAISMDDYYAIFDILRNKNIENLHFYIETPGGSGEASEEIVRFLHNKFNHIEFVVSGEAKSAGTIIVLSGDEIIMTESGSLGPIDAQVRIGRGVISAHDYIEWVETKRTDAQTTKTVNPVDATIIAQISPGEFKGVYNSLKFAEDLVEEWLVKYKFKNWRETETRKIPVTEEMKAARAKDIATNLTNHSWWRSHGRSIKIEDLEEIGLKIVRIDNNKEIAEIIYRIQTILRLLFLTSSTYKIFATQDEKVGKEAVSVNEIQNLPVQKPNPNSIIEVGIECPNCAKEHKLFAQFQKNKQIHQDQIAKGLKPFTKDNKLVCDCGFEFDLRGIKSEIETQTKCKIEIEEDLSDEQ